MNLQAQRSPVNPRVIACVAAALFACERAPDLGGAVNVERPPPVVPAPPVVAPEAPKPETPRFDPVGVSLEAGAEVSIMPVPAELEAETRSRRRMDLDQLDAAIRTVSGGFAWEVNGVNQLTALAATLGKPDYVTITQEDLDATQMFQKFLDDAGRSVCAAMVARDVPAAESARVLMKHAAPTDTLAASPGKIDANLAYLLMRFHGRSAASLGGELAQWRWLYQSAEHVASSPVEAWRTVCVALFNHPDFYTY